MSKRSHVVPGVMVAALALAVAALAIAMPAGNAAAQTQAQSVLRISSYDGAPVTRHVRIGLNKSLIVELPREVRDVLVSNPKMLDAVVHSSKRAYLIGLGIGQANAFFFDKNGDQLLTLEVTIDKDAAPLEDLFHRLIPDSDIKVEFLNDTVILSGTVAHAADASRASDIASRFVTSDPTSNTREHDKVINMIDAGSREQVLLKVTVAEVERNTLKQLGINWDGNFGIGSGVLGFGSNPAFALGQNVLANIINPDSQANPNLATTTGGNGIGTVFNTAKGSAIANVRALERNGLLRTLAEPNLTAISGESANFLAGGEFPIVTGVDPDTNTPTISFKKFGVSLNFTPVVLSEGRISMKLETEVSELSNEGAVLIAGQAVPSLKVRRANTTVELPSGGSLAMAGLISDDTRQSIDGIPGLKNLPILGSLFRSRDFKRSESELVILVTPYVVDPTARANLARPDDGLAPASDASALFLGQLNRVYGREPAAPPPSKSKYHGDFGFIVD